MLALTLLLHCHLHSWDMLRAMVSLGPPQPPVVDAEAHLPWASGPECAPLVTWAAPAAAADDDAAAVACWWQV